MRPSKTTLAGSAAGVLFAAGQVPSIPEWLKVAFNFGAALSMIQLGRHARDCPANCPGTDERGFYREDVRQQSLGLSLAASFIVVAITLSGCTSANPNAGQGDPPAPAFVVNPSLVTTSNQVHQIAATVDQVSASGGLLQLTVAGVFAAIAGVSGLVARHKSKVASTMADAIATAGPVAAQHMFDATTSRTKGPAVREEITAARRRLVTSQPQPAAAPLDANRPKV